MLFLPSTTDLLIMIIYSADYPVLVCLSEGKTSSRSDFVNVSTLQTIWSSFYENAEKKKLFQLNISLHEEFWIQPATSACFISKDDTVVSRMISCIYFSNLIHLQWKGNFDPVWSRIAWDHLLLISQQIPCRNMRLCSVQSGINCVLWTLVFLQDESC